MKYAERECSDISMLKDKMLSICDKYNNSSKSFVGTDDEVKHLWGNDVNADDINKKIIDLKHYPHIFVLACLMDKQMPAEKAWAIPYIICRSLCNGRFDFNSLLQLDADTIEEYFVSNKLHRFPSDAADTFCCAIDRIANEYEGDASKIWTASYIENKLPSSSEVIYRFMQFKGCGVKIGTMATNILHRDLNVKYSDYYSLDISPDIHVKRVLYRLGLVNEMTDIQSIIYMARMLNPEYPGKIDNICWEIGRNYCSPLNGTNNPNCNTCPFNKHCKFNDDVKYLNKTITGIPQVIAIEKVSISDIRPLLSLKHKVAYMDVSRIKDFNLFLNFITGNKNKVICLDNVESLKLTSANDKIAQIIYFLISQEEYSYNGINIDFSNYSCIILSDEKDIKHSKYNFMSYAAKKGCYKYIL